MGGCGYGSAAAGRVRPVCANHTYDGAAPAAGNWCRPIRGLGDRRCTGCVSIAKRDQRDILICRNEWDLRGNLAEQVRAVGIRQSRSAAFSARTALFLCPPGQEEVCHRNVRRRFLRHVFPDVGQQRGDLVGTIDTLNGLTTSAYDPAAGQDTPVISRTSRTNWAPAPATQRAALRWIHRLRLHRGHNTWMLDCADEVVASTTLTWRSAIIYDSTPGSATNPLALKGRQRHDHDWRDADHQSGAAGLGTITLS